MTQPFVKSIVTSSGLPATVRVGTIESVNPLVLTVQSTQFSNDAVGVLGSYSPVAGDSVPVLGQSAQPGSDPSTWLILGKAVGALGQGRGIGDIKYANATADLSTTAVDTAITGAMFSITTTRPDALLLTWWTTDFRSVLAAVTLSVSSLRVDNAARPQLGVFGNSAASQRATVSQMCLVTVATPGVHTVALFGQKLAGTDAAHTIGTLHTTVMSAVIE